MLYPPYIYTYMSVLHTVYIIVCVAAAMFYLKGYVRKTWLSTTARIVHIILIPVIPRRQFPHRNTNNNYHAHTFSGTNAAVFSARTNRFLNLYTHLPAGTCTVGARGGVRYRFQPMGMEVVGVRPETFVCNYTYTFPKPLPWPVITVSP